MAAPASKYGAPASSQQTDEGDDRGMAIESLQRATQESEACMQPDLIWTQGTMGPACRRECVDEEGELQELQG